MSNVTKLARQQNTNRDLALGESPEELVAAEAALEQAESEKATAAAEFARLEAGFDDLNLRRPDGSRYPTDRTADLIELFERRRRAEASEEAARRLVNQLRRGFGDAEAARLERAGDALCADLRDKLEEFEQLLDAYAEMQREATERRIPVRHQTLDAAIIYRPRLHQLRGELIPPVKFEGRR